jgi:hypothetical protein
MGRLKENLDYTFSWKDLITVDKLMRKYINDRELMCGELFDSSEEFTRDDINEYVEWFMGCASDMDIDVKDKDKKHHKYLYNIRHFLDRNYEFNLLPSYMEKTANINDCLYCLLDDANNLTDDEVKEFVDDEHECIENLKLFWNDYLETLVNYPMMHLENMNKTVVMGSDVYFDKKTDDFVLSSFLEFLQNVKRDFPSLLNRFDRFLIVDNDYLKFLADDEEGEGETQAFFTDNAIFLKCHCDDLKDESERFFYKEVLYHEFGHYVFENLPEYLQLYWQENYLEWKNKDLKMCRDKDRNTQLDVYMNELHSDCFACHYLGDKMTDEDYIHMPSPVIMDCFEFMLKKAFGEN